jgi:hypothetical protein
MKQQIAASVVVAILAFSVFTVIGLAPMRNASAQGVTIETSADAHGGSFFGQGVLQVIINGDDEDDNLQETISVDIDADGDTSTSGTFQIPETSESSGKYEFFLVHVDSDFFPDGVGPTTIDQDNVNGISDYATTTGQASPGIDAPMIDFGAGAAELDTGAALYDALVDNDVSFDIDVDGETATADYEETFAVLSVDREDGTYGSTSIVYVTVTDQDGNWDPTNADTYTIPGADVAALFDVEGGAFEDALVLDETADNSAIFEITTQLDALDDDEADSFVPTTDAIELTLNDMAAYDDIPNAANDVEDSTSGVNFEIDDDDGTIGSISTLSFATELKLSITDTDQNEDSDAEDDIDDAVEVCTEEGDDCVTLDMEETGDNTGIFEPDLSNSEVEITFVAEGDQDGLNTALELEPDDVTGDIVVTYTDPLPDSPGDDTFERTLELTLQDGQISVPDTVGINDDFTVTITDNDLNDDPRVRDIYSVTLDDTDTEYQIMRGTTDLGEFAFLEVDIQGDTADFSGGDITETVTETGINTGIFEIDFDMAEILDSAGADDIDDGDSIEFTYNDLFDDVSRTPSDELSIGSADTEVDFSRTSVPIPPDPASDYVDVTGNEDSFVTVTVTAPDENENSNTEETIPWIWEEDAEDDEPSFIVTLDGDGVDETINCLDDTDVDAGPDCDDDTDYDADSVLFDITDGELTGLTLAETGDATGIFDEELTFIRGALEDDEYQDLELTIEFFDADPDVDDSDEPDSTESGITFRGNDGAVSTNVPSARSGTSLTVTVQDEDLNLDDDTVEEFPSSDTADATFIVLIETEDDDIATLPNSESFRETGADTGIFEATFVIGDEIEVTEDDGEEITQATNILITYNDETDSTGGSGDELEVNVPVATSTGAIEVSPELVGPATEIVVLITDTDLDQDASSSEDYNPDDPNSDDFFVTFRSDRDEVGEAAPDLEETGPNTGVFMFTIELVTDEQACEDDDLDADEFDAEGGNEPQIGACPGDLLAIAYEDEITASGGGDTVSAVVEVKSYDPEFVADKDAYAVGDKITITISDPDANRNPDIADSLTDIRTFSDSDQVGEEFSALETGPNTGVFRLSFATSESSTGGAITVDSGDTVTIEYTDDYPADFEEEENDKDFQFSVLVGEGGGEVGVATPAVEDASGNPVPEITVGKQVILTTTLSNQNAGSQPFVALVEVRDSNDVTTYLAWQTGTLSANGSADIGLSWTPEFAGSYEVRSFAISSLSNPQILSDIAESTVSVT